eukprot:5289233-Prymnesium_polylepis.2
MARGRRRCLQAAQCRGRKCHVTALALARINTLHKLVRQLDRVSAARLRTEVRGNLPQHFEEADVLVVWDEVTEQRTQPSLRRVLQRGSALLRCGWRTLWHRIRPPGGKVCVGGALSEGGLMRDESTYPLASTTGTVPLCDRLVREGRANRGHGWECGTQVHDAVDVVRPALVAGRPTVVAAGVLGGHDETRAGSCRRGLR